MILGASEIISPFDDAPTESPLGNGLGLSCFLGLALVVPSSSLFVANSTAARLFGATGTLNTSSPSPIDERETSRFIVGLSEGVWAEDHFRRADLSSERRERSLALKGEGTGRRDEVEERAEVEEVEGKSLVRW